MSKTFVQTLLDAIASMPPEILDDGFDAPADASPHFPDTDDALASVMLDGSRLSVDEIRRGAYVTLLRVPDGAYGLISDFLNIRILGCLETVVDPATWSIKAHIVDFH